jgi:hypothetical protein
LVVFRRGSGDDATLDCFVVQEGELVPVLMEEVESEQLMREETQALRVRGTLNLVAGQNENDLQIAFKHLIEKVSERP